MPKIKLQTADKEIFEVELGIAYCSGTIKTMIEACGLSDEGNDAVVPLPNVNAATLRKVLKWAEYHKHDEDAEEENECLEEATKMTQWDKEFLNIDQETLRDLIMTANYLDIRRLLRSGCKIVAQMIRGKQPEEIRQMFNIENDIEAATVL